MACVQAKKEKGQREQAKRKRRVRPQFNTWKGHKEGGKNESNSKRAGPRDRTQEKMSKRVVGTKALGPE